MWMSGDGHDFMCWFGHELSIAPAKHVTGLVCEIQGRVSSCSFVGQEFGGWLTRHKQRFLAEWYSLCGVQWRSPLHIFSAFWSHSIHWLLDPSSILKGRNTTSLLPSPTDEVLMGLDWIDLGWPQVIPTSSSSLPWPYLQSPFAIEVSRHNI